MMQLGSPTRRFVTLRATRWLPTGLLLPVLVLLLTSRGLSLGQIGLGFVAQGVIVFLLELPTGGLADALGRRPVLLVASAVEASSMLVLLIADTPGEVFLVFAMQGLYRSLESGPLDAWYVDAAHAANPDAASHDVVVTSGLSAGGVATGLAVAGGALISGGLVAWHPVDTVDALAVPVLIAAVLRLVDLAAITALMTEESGPMDLGAMRASVRAVPTVVHDALSVIRTSHALIALICVEVLWGFALVAYETLVPPRLSEVVDGPEAAATIFGPVVTAAWLLSAGFAAIVPLVAKRFGHIPAAISMHLAQTLAIIGMAVVAGPVLLVTFYLLTMGLHGALNPIYQTLIHGHVEAAHRTTVLSATSMAAHPGGALGAIALGFLADATSVGTAMIAGAVVLVGVVPLYWMARGSGTTEPAVA